MVFTANLFDLLWLNRNRVLHGSTSFSVLDLLTEASKCADNHWKSITTSTQAAGSSPNQAWKPTPVGWIKINTDASFANGISQSRFLLRNHKGSILWASSHSHHCLDALTAETLALQDACKFINHLKIKEAIFESDSLNAITFINNASSARVWTANPVINEIRKCWNAWPK